MSVRHHTTTANSHNLIFETWKPHPELPGYEFSDLGQAATRWTIGGYERGRRGGTKKQLGPRKIMKPSTYNQGRYLSVTIRRGQRKVRIPIHRGVLECFVGPRPCGMHCRHLDGNSHNNRLDNLKWGTPAENKEDQRRHGTIARGSITGGAILTEQQVIEIRTRREKDGESTASLAQSFGVCKSSIKNIICRRNWKHI